MPQRRKWNYLVRTFSEVDESDTLFSAELNALGKRGWELVAFDIARSRAFFTREAELVLEAANAD